KRVLIKTLESYFSIQILYTKITSSIRSITGISQMLLLTPMVYPRDKKKTTASKTVMRSPYFILNSTSADWYFKVKYKLFLFSNFFNKP
ncbi:MAG: hypothetical protein DRM98_04095, partial [Thermoplasmata archaeon]